MPIKTFRPITASLRFTELNVQEDLTKKRPERALTKSQSKSGGRNCYGRLTSRRRGGGHKRLYRVIDFKRNKLEIPATVQALEYDPNRSANLALLAYADGEKRYILAPNGIKVGHKVVATDKAEFAVGNNVPLSIIPPATKIHAVELYPGRGAQIARSAGNAAELVGVDGKQATIKLPSGEIRLVSSRCRATIGEVGNGEHMNQSLGKAGRNRWLGKRPRVRGMAMNPVDHPNGGGQGKSKGGGGHLQLVSPWGQLAKSFPTRRKSKETNGLIITRRNGRKLKKN
ncbi:50S ribosomal protein L2 [Opitutales bacterium ASA1]|uniref:50S ribosomal protein L2 n=1 Tax=Congregicoccus parvus TaxID=3081749 RepID=UPI002B30A99E|nr:50S ribosomal protein L2 [Opitutales bacterium ASA1]